MCNLAERYFIPFLLPHTCLNWSRHSCIISQSSSILQSLSSSWGIWICLSLFQAIFTTAKSPSLLISFTQYDRSNCNKLHLCLPFSVLGIYLSPFLLALFLSFCISFVWKSRISGGFIITILCKITLNP